MNFKFKTAAIAAISAGALAGALVASAQSTTASCFSFTQNMKLGTTNSEVMQLQKSLNSMGYTVAATGVGSKGNEVSYFGAKTKAAVAKFQAANNVTTTGNVYGLTRAALNAKCGTTTTTSTSTPTTSGSVSVSIAASQPNNVLVAGSVNSTLTNVSFSGNGTVTSVKLMRTGVSNNTTLSNVYLYDTMTGARLTDAASVLTDGTVNFTNGYGLFTVAGSKAITVKADIACNDVNGTVNSICNTSGQSVGMSVVGYTTLGNPAAMVSGVNGPALPIGSADIVKATLVSTSTVSTTVDAGRQNVVFFDGSVNTSKDSYMSGALFSFTGSAPYSVFANVKLYVDGVQVGNAASIDAMGKVTFVGGTSFLRSGTHSVSLRGDVTGGAGRDYYVRLEDAGLSFEDANIRGVYGALSGFSTTNTKTNTVSINSCASTNCSIYSVDGTFSGAKVVSGASNQTIGKYTFKSVGESVKFISGTLGVTGTNTGDIRNVSVFVDGVQVVSGKTLALSGTATSLTNLGGVVVNMGTTSVIEIKADISSSTGIALSSMNLVARLSLDVQGVDSRNSTTFAALASNQVTVGTLNATFTNNSNFTGSKISGTQSGVKVGSYTLSTGNEAVRLTGIKTTFTPANSLNLSTVTNFRLMDGTNQVWSQSNVGSGVSASTVSASPYIDIAANSTKTFDVVVDFNNAVNMGTIAVTGEATYQGVVSLTNKTDTLATAQMTTVSTPSLVKIAKASASLSDRYVVGGAINNAAVFTLTATGTAFTATKMQVVVSNPAAISAVTIAGVNAINRGNGIFSADVSKSIETIGTDVAVNVTFNTANRDTNTLSGTTTMVTLSYVYGSTGSTNVTVGSEDTTSVASTTALGVSTSSAFTVVGAYPTVKMTGNTSTVSPGTFNNVNLGTVTITPVGGVVSVSAFGINIPTGVTSARIVDATGNVVTNATLSAGVAGAQTVTLTAGNITTPATYTIQGSGSNGGTVSTVMGASLGAVTTLSWNDVTGSASATAITGNNLLPNYNN